ncbi:hypothetical protein HN873_052851, partial [Arachis hypogaea]
TILHPQQFTTEPPPRPASGRALNPLISFQKSPRSRNHRSTVHHPVTHSHQPSSHSPTPWSSPSSPPPRSSELASSPLLASSLDNVRDMVDNFLEFVVNNHHVNREREPVSMLQAFQISLVRTAISNIFA